MTAVADGPHEQCESGPLEQEPELGRGDGGVRSATREHSTVIIYQLIKPLVTETCYLGAMSPRHAYRYGWYA